MNQRPLCGLLRNCSTRLTFERSIFVLSKQKRRGNERKKDGPKRNSKLDGSRSDAKDRQLRNVDTFKSLMANSSSLQYKNLGPQISGGDSGKEQVSANDSMHSKISPSGSESTLKSDLSFNPKLSSLASPAMEVPSIFKAKLGPAVKYLVNKEHQNWQFALEQIDIAGGFKDANEIDIRKLVYAIPKNQLVVVFPMIERLLLEAGKQKSPKIVNTYLRSLIAGGTLSDERLQLMESYVSELRPALSKKRLSRETYEILVEAYGKSRRIDQMEIVINEMKSHGLSPSFNVYNSVLNTCVYKTRDHKQAVQIFDSMKFLAGNMAPGLFQYQDIIVSYVNNNDIERALDLFEEMKGKNIQANQRILVALAKGCMTRASLRFQSWNFIFEIYESGWEPAVFTLEHMIYLAAKDGDLSLSRALYWHLYNSGSVSPRSFGFLMGAYAKFGFTQNADKFKVPSISHHEFGRNFRANIIQKANFMPNVASLGPAIPFLPIKSLMDSKQILSESNAVLAHASLANPTFVTQESITSFLETAATLGSLSDFVDRYNKFTFFDEIGVPRTRVEANSLAETESVEIYSIDEPAAFDSQKDETLLQVPTHKKSPNFDPPTIKFRRTTNIFCIALEAAARHRDFDYSQSIWSERGRYRKSDFFRRMSQTDKKKSDFMFATKMVKCLSDMALLDDALAILLSTEFQFKWTWKELNSLYAAAVDVGHEKVSAVVRGIANRAQINFEGKIKRREFKTYVSKQH